MSRQLHLLAYLLAFGPKEPSGFAGLTGLMTRLAERGHQLHVVCRDRNFTGDRLHYQWENGGSLRIYPVASQPGRLAFAQRALRQGIRIARTQPVDLVYSHIIQYYALLSCTVAKLARRPHVFWLCGGGREQTVSLPMWTRMSSSVLVRSIFASSTKIFTCTEFCRREQAAQYGAPPSKFVIIPNGVDTELFSVAGQGHPSNGAEEGRILYLSSLGPLKGIDVLLEAVALLQNRGVKASLTTIGEEGDWGAEARHFVHQRGLTNVEFLGPVPHAELPKYLGACQVFCVPARFQGFGRVYVEAMAAGKPVVATTAGGIPEVVRDGETGLLVKPGDPVALAEALERVLTDGELAQRLGNQGQRIAQERYSNQAVAELYEKALLHVIEST